MRGPVAEAEQVVPKRSVLALSAMTRGHSPPKTDPFATPLTPIPR